LKQNGVTRLKQYFGMTTTLGSTWQNGIADLSSEIQEEE
jgi:hypothetical protein